MVASIAVPVTPGKAKAGAKGSGKEKKEVDPALVAFYQKVIQTFKIDLIMSDLTIEGYDIRMKPGFNTACWYWAPPHKVFLGDLIWDRYIGVDTEEGRSGYLLNYLVHEFGHAFFTIKSLKDVKKALKKIDAPFSLFNLFEDARIEDRIRVAMKHEFKWTSFEESKEASKPSAMLFNFIQQEGDADKVTYTEVMEWVDREGNPVRKTGEEVFKRVQWYYTETLKRTDSLKLLPLLQQWMEEFGEAPPDGERFGPGSGSGSGGEPGEGDPGEGGSELEVAEELQSSEDARAKFEEGTTSLTDKEGGDPAMGTELSMTCSEAGTEDLLRSKSSINYARVAANTTRMARLFQSVERMSSTDVPGKKARLDKFIVGNPSFYRRKTTKAPGKKKISFVVDCSGSMGGFPMEEGRILLSTVNALARRGKVEGYLILSAVTGGRKGSWQRFKFPVSDEVIERISGFANAEGIEHTLRNNVAELRKSDITFVYTDAHIVDDPVDKAWLHLRGVETYGVYVGHSANRESMEKYFDQFVSRETVESLIDSLLKNFLLKK